MAKKDDSANARYEELLAPDPFGMFDVCGLDNEMLASMLNLAKRLAGELRDKDLTDDMSADLQADLANQVRAIEVIHELNAERFHQAQQILHAAGIPKQFAH